MQEASTSRSEFQIEVRDPVKHGEGVSVCSSSVPDASFRYTCMHCKLFNWSARIVGPVGTCLIQGHDQN